MADKPAPSDSYVRNLLWVTLRTKLFYQLLDSLSTNSIGETMAEIAKSYAHLNDLKVARSRRRLTRRLSCVAGVVVIPSHFQQAGVAICPVNRTDECPHNRTLPFDYLTTILPSDAFRADGAAG
jgi:hypothetical protein